MGRPESGKRTLLAAWLLMRDLLRRRSAVMAMLALPLVFHAVILVTVPHKQVDVMIPVLAEPCAQGDEDDPPNKNWMAEKLIDDGTRKLDEQAVSLIFLSGAAIGFLAAYVAFYLVHPRVLADRRLRLAGYRAGELYGAKSAVLVLVTLLVAAGELGLIGRCFSPAAPGRLLVAFVLLGLTYGGFGMLVGIAVRQELAGMFAIVLLANIDVGWLQNPAYYAETRNRWLVRALPGHRSVQAALAAAFDAGSHGDALLGALWPMLGMLAVAAVVFGIRLSAARIRAISTERVAYFKLMAAACGLWLVCFELVGHVAALLPTYDLTTVLDRKLPLVPGAVWAYEACYLLPWVPVCVARDWHRVNVALIASVLANVTAFAVYLLLPVAFPRPPLGNSWAERVLALEYACDFSPGANHLPSMHVALALLVLLACLGQGRGRVFEAALGAVVFSVCVSTLLVKQHLAVDVVFGVAWALLSWQAATRIYGRRRCADLGPLENLGRVCRPWRHTA